MDIITQEQYLKALQIIRAEFNILNKDLYDELDNKKKTGTFHVRQIHHFDYLGFSEVLEKGFQSLNLHQLFEALVYLHFFKDLVTSDIDLPSFITFNKFDSKRFFKDVKQTLKLLIAVNILEAWTKQALQAFNVKKIEMIDFRACAKAIEYGKNKDLHHYGDVEFVVSKMDFGTSDYKFEKSIPINPNIFYTASPKQIANLVSLAKPGIYIVANIPEGQYQDTAFYVIFRQEKYAYIVENNKHSYRDQFYRNKTDGTSGKDAFLNDKYNHSFFPIQIVLDFMQRQSSSSEVLDKQTLDFVSLGNLFDCAPEIILWHYAFIDTCVEYFLREELAKQITTATCIEFMKPELPNRISNLPAVYGSSIPILASLDMSWSGEKVGIEDMPEMSLERIRPDVSLEEISLPSSKFTSVEQVHREMIFNKRKKEAELMQKALDKDFIEHFDEVVKKIQDFIHAKGIEFLASKALEDVKYPLRIYRQFGDYEHLVRPEWNSKVIEMSLLEEWNPKKIIPWRFTGDRRCLYYNMDKVYIKNMKCDSCGKFKASHYYLLNFKEYAQFKSFFEIVDDSIIPEQLRNYLNQERMIYLGNSILDDIDPVAMVKIPWWRTFLSENSSINHYHNFDDEARLSIRFNLCGRCLRRMKLKDHDQNK